MVVTRGCEDEESWWTGRWVDCGGSAGAGPAKGVPRGEGDSTAQLTLDGGLDGPAEDEVSEGLWTSLAGRLP